MPPCHVKFFPRQIHFCPSGLSMGGFSHVALHPAELYRNKHTGVIGLF